jgi:hypothetical protein
MQQRRFGVMVLAALVGAMFAAGLFVRGPVGGILLAVTDVVLVVLARMMWPRLRPLEQAIRVVVIAAIAVIAVVKIAG